MNDIIKHKKNHPCPSSTAICKMITQHMSATDFFVPENNVRLTEDQRRINDLYLQLSEAKDKLNINKEALEEKTTKLNIENQKLKELEIERNKIIKNNYNLERKCNEMRVIKPSTKDRCILDLGQKKFNLYKKFTRIRWDYGALDQTRKGLVTDGKSYIHTFSFHNDIGSNELSDLLWKEIQLSVEKKSSDNNEEKENNAVNK
ncbi:uncharacterized protein LOC124182938 [Neodiprion fabricii]|uniref:uncharacterized protein LOC124182938 n=1 Tax=Neodiprion fabricii TaxID=2872261 RepID=UPI001ED975EE|nr:uncharacterized protein LOC124182938 [Neodiprion fabricii]XP_046426723.1 uncharacterized protein LOC124182938 [Neodiprion fabricii]